MTKILEGMRPNDLEDLILPMISIDEYESKLDPNAIVIGFYVNDREAAEDLNRFIQKSAVQLLDTEVSPAPDQHGFYLVFFELLNDKRILDNLKSVLHEVGPLAGHEKWQMSLRGNDVEDLSFKILGKRFEEMVKQGEQPMNYGIMEFLTPSDLQDVILEENQLTLIGLHEKFKADIVDFGETNSLLMENQLVESAISLDIEDAVRYRKILRILGEGWNSNVYENYTLLYRNGSPLSLLLQNSTFL